MIALNHSTACDCRSCAPHRYGQITIVGTYVTGDAYGYDQTYYPSIPNTIDWSREDKYIADRFRRLAASVRQMLEDLRVDLSRWPRALATPNGPPPVTLENSTLRMVQKCQPGLANSPRKLEITPILRLHARQAVPARTRRKVRVFERERPKR